ncbi:hypothetical protein [Myxosarcina sp. GI1]|uniref:hypothetical protein n=1 Tax=Myxosarcina sp. GI1 TaxID=1541065 RepID=UPI00068A9E60|nr:hypothetical protein [Myxosarcina sp. GI1]
MAISDRQEPLSIEQKKAKRRLINIGYAPHSGWITIGVSPHGFISIGAVPHGFISIGLVPMGVLSFGVVSMGLLSVGTVSMGLLSFGKTTMSIVQPHEGHNMTMPNETNSDMNMSH